MKTEIFIALILGTLLGLGGMFLVARFTDNSNPSVTSNTSSNKNETPSSPETVKNEIISPLNNISWDNSALPVKGTVTEGNFIFIVADNSDIVLATEGNNFNGTVTPPLGISDYRIFSQFGEKLGEAQVVNFKELPQNKRLSFGIVTDLTAESLQIRGGNGTIDQIAFAPAIVVGNFIKDIKKISTSDIAIGDKIIVVSDTGQKAQTLALGIFVISPDYGISNLTLKTGALSEINKTELKITTKEGDVSVKTDSNTKFFGIKENGTLRKRTKLIPTDKSRTVFATVLGDSQIIRTLFISE